MTAGSEVHLNEEQISLAVVDDADLDAGVRQHLSGCQVCRDRVERFREVLFGIGHHARSAVPPMTKTVTLPRGTPARESHVNGWLPSFAAAVMTGVVLFIYFLGVETTPPQMTAEQQLQEQYLPLQSPEPTIEDETLMDDIYQMVQYPLPDVMYEITGDSGDDFDDFMQFVIPDDQEDSQS